MAITLADFTKIWASTSPLTPYSFSESNYKEGWNFVGSIPPARQMWDAIQNQNDEKLKYLMDNFADYLPLAGGTMTGTIIGNPLTLSADDGNDSADFVLNPSGSATWNGKEVERVNAIGTNYIRYENGLQICWDSSSVVCTSSGSTVFPYFGTKTMTYPQAFVNTPVAMANVNEWPSHWNAAVFSVSTSQCNVMVAGNNNTQAKNFSYVAIGFWK